jgi:hypothetical protein|tara:strand:- start:312 stop:467 length:156 start_codon:yes stop_codon:yes gene_type:complete
MDKKTDIDELERLEEKAKKHKCSKEDHLKIIAYRFALKLIPDEVYWQEISV